MRTRSRWLAALGLGALSLCAASALAHDLWLVPTKGDRPGQVVTIEASSGMDFPVSEQAPDTAQFARRILIRPDGSAGTLEAAGKRDKAGLLRFTPADPGIYVAAVVSQARLIELSAADFNHYLVADGLPHIYNMRHKEKTLDQPAKERYSKSPKTLVRIGDGGGDPGRVVGLPLEIIPLRNPFRLRAGDTLPLRVLFQGNPLADANLGWDHPGDGEPPSGTVRSNAKGEALVPIGHSGLMTIRLTHMTRPMKEEYEWESFWTTLTFAIPSADDAAK